jgi:hypothetical protein
LILPDGFQKHPPAADYRANRERFQSWQEFSRAPVSEAALELWSLERLTESADPVDHPAPDFQ